MGGRAGTTQQINSGNSGNATPIPPGSLTNNYVVFGAGGDNIKIETLLGQSTPGAQSLYTEPGVTLDISATAPVAGAGAAVTVTASAGVGAVNGGAVTITAGASGAGATGNGGAVTMTAGAAASTDGTGGAAGITAGAGTGSGNGGAATMTAGAAGATGAGGSAIVTGGAGGATSGAGGTAQLAGGAATAGNSAGGIANVLGGAGSGTQAGGQVQAIAGAGGATGAGGAVQITGGAGGATSGLGGAVAMAGGSASANNDNGGAVNISGGAPHGTGLRGLINFTGSLTFNTNEVTLNANQDDYTGGDGYGVLKINATGNFDLTGLANPVSGRQLLIYNTGSSTCTLKHDATSAAANRFYLPGAADLALTQYTGVLVEYAPTVARWVVVGMSVSSGAPGLQNVAYVSKGGSDATAALNNIAKPYLTIAAAITAAAATGNPYTIQLGTGTWTENLTWAEQLSLRGLGSRVSIISGTFTLTAGATTNTNNLNFSDVQITGATAINFNGKTSGQSKLTFSGCIIGGNLTLTQDAGGASDQVSFYNCQIPNTVTHDFNALLAVGCDFGTLTQTFTSGGETVNLLACNIGTLSFTGAGSFLRIEGSKIISAFTWNDAFGGTCQAAGSNFSGATVTLSTAGFSQNGCVFTNSGYLASGTPGTLDFTYWGGVVVVTAAATATLPANARKGFVVTIKNGNSVASGNNVTIARNGNSIEGSAADYVIGPLSSVTLIADGTNWWIVS